MNIVKDTGEKRPSQFNAIRNERSGERSFYHLGVGVNHSAPILDDPDLCTCNKAVGTTDDNKSEHEKSVSADVYEPFFPRRLHESR